MDIPSDTPTVLTENNGYCELTCGGKIIQTIDLIKLTAKADEIATDDALFDVFG